MKRQDRQGVRTPADLEVKYDFTQSFNALEQRQKDNEVAQTQFKNETEETLASLKESAANTNAALSNFNTRLTKTEKNALRLELAIKNMGGKPSGSLDLTQFWEKIDETKKLFEEGFEAIKTQIAELQARVRMLEQIGFDTNITATHDGNGNVTLGGVSAIHIGNGNVVLSGASAFCNESGGVRLV